MDLERRYRRRNSFCDGETGGGGGEEERRRGGEAESNFVIARG